jgi:hypothetical protein
LLGSAIRLAVGAAIVSTFWGIGETSVRTASFGVALA